MRKNQIKKINLSLVFSIFFIVLVMGVAYSLYAERYVSGNNYIIMGDIHVKKVDEVSRTFMGLYPENADEAKSSIFHPEEEVILNGEKYYIRDNEIALLVDGANSSNVDMNYIVSLEPGEEIEGKTRIKNSDVWICIEYEDLLTGEVETVQQFSASDTANPYYELNTKVVNAGGIVKFLVRVCVFMKDTVLVSDAGTSNVSYTFDQLANSYFSCKIVIKNGAEVSTIANGNTNNMGLYRINNKSLVTSIVTEHVDENELLNSVNSLTRLDYDSDIDFSDMDGAYIDLSQDRVFTLTGDYSGASECTTLGESFCSGNGFYPETFVTLPKMFASYGVYLNRDELEELEDAGIIEMVSSYGQNYTFGFFNDGVLTLKYSGDDIVLPRDSQFFFSGFSNLTSVDFTHVDTSKVRSLVGFFKNDASLNNVDLRKNKKSTWTTMNSMFYGCSSLNKYSFNYYATNLDEYYYHSSSFDYIANPKDVAYLFYHCTSLTTTTSDNYLIIDDGFVNCSFVENYAHMLEGCTSLVNLNVRNNGLLYGDSNNMSFAYLFKDCVNLENLYTNDIGPVVSYYTDCEGMYYNCTSLTSLPFMFGYASASYVDPRTNSKELNVKFDYIFYNCTGATSVSFGSSGFENFVVSMAHAFENCSNLVEVESPYSGLENLKNAYMMFAGCSSLEEVDVNYFANSINTPNLENMEKMFYNCTSLQVVNDYDSGVMNFKIGSSVTNMKEMFSGCTNLVYVCINESTINATPNNVNSMFTGCTSLQNIELSLVEFGRKYGNGLDSNNHSLFGYPNSYDSSFSLNTYDCSFIYVTDFSKFFKENTKISRLELLDDTFSEGTSFIGSFQCMTNLTYLNFSIYLKKGRNYSNSGLDLTSLCEGCSSLIDVNIGIGNSISGAIYPITISTFTSGFSNCTSLQNIYFDKVVMTDTGMNSLFSNDSSLNHIYITETYLDINNNRLWDTFHSSINVFYRCDHLPNWSNAKATNAYGKLIVDGGYLEIEYGDG